MIGVASTYLDGEQNSIAPEEILFAPTLVVGLLGAAAHETTAEARREMIRNGQTSMIEAIKNRQCMVDGSRVFVVYDGYLTSAPDRPGFFVAERFTIEGGLITEILVCGVQHPESDVG